MKKKHIYYNEKEDKFHIVTQQQVNSFGVWFYPAHGFIYIDEL